MQSKRKPDLGNRNIKKYTLERNFFVAFRHLNFSMEANELELPFLFDAVSFNRSLDSLNWVISQVANSNETHRFKMELKIIIFVELFFF